MTPRLQRQKKDSFGKMREQKKIDAWIAVIMLTEDFVPRQESGLVLYGKRNVLLNKSLYNGISLF